MIEICDESTADARRFQLYVDGGRAAVLVKKNNLISLNWQVHGPQLWPEAKDLLQGLLDLSVIADNLSGETGGHKEKD